MCLHGISTVFRYFLLTQMTNRAQMLTFLLHILNVATLSLFQSCISAFEGWLMNGLEQLFCYEVWLFFCNRPDVGGRFLTEEEFSARIEELTHEWEGQQAAPKLKLFMAELRPNFRKWKGDKTPVDVLQTFQCLQEGSYVSL